MHLPLNRVAGVGLRQAAVLAIAGYQRYLSPYKGFRCAYRCHTGRHSCSEYALRIVRRRGVLALRVALPRQFERCRGAYAAMLAVAAEREERKKSKDGRNSADCTPNGCDLPCDIPCDVPCDCSF